MFNALSFDNGLTKTGNLVQLGGALVKSTEIITSATNTLKISGLESGNLATDSLVVSGSDGTLKRVTAESLLQSGDQNYTSTAGQSAFTVSNMPTAVSKVWVYRNGVKLLPTVDYTIGSGEINFTAAISALVAAGDVIEIQWVK